MSDWGQGVINNTIGWGQGADNNDIGWGSVYGQSYAGDTALEVGFAFLLDENGGATAAYSLRKLSSTFSGSAIRVRRSSDNAEQDIGFSNNELDSTSLLSFVGAGDGFVATWYDQSGNSNNATQTTASKQGRIVASGVLQTENGKAAIKPINGAVDYNTSLTGTTNPWNFCVLKAPAFGGGTGSVLNSNAAGNRFVLLEGVGGVGASSNTGTYNVIRVNNSTLADTTQGGVHTALLNQALLTFNINSDALLGASFKIGYPASNAFGIPIMQEYIRYESNQTANRAAIEENINAYYSIY